LGQNKIKQNKDVPQSGSEVIETMEKRLLCRVYGFITFELDAKRFGRFHTFDQLKAFANSQVFARRSVNFSNSLINTLVFFPFFQHTRRVEESIKSIGAVSHMNNTLWEGN
jgi:hypothetical protein